MNPAPKEPAAAASSDTSEFLGALKNGLLIGAVILAVALPARHYWNLKHAPASAASVTLPMTAPPSSAKSLPAAPPRLATFGNENPSPDVRHVANWASYTGDSKGKSFVVVDKKDAKVYVFNPKGELQSSTPALMGSAHGDDSVPGIGTKPIPEVLPEERTTPAGRFVAMPGVNATGEDVVWVDYDAAVSMHRVRPLVKAERRLERLASASSEDNRISYGCINLPVAFYEGVLSPTVKATGAVIYVLPETRTPQQVFGSYDVQAPAMVAAR